MFMEVNMFKGMSRMLVALSAGLMLFAGFLSAQQSYQGQSRNGNKNALQNRNQMKVLFVDENGDGICDFVLDHDGDGIPNSQDPDWDRPRDGSGLRAQQGRGGAGQPAFKNQFRNPQNMGLNKQSFRNGGQFGSGICDGSGPKGQSRRSGKK
jgi:hypothetical protein